MLVTRSQNYLRSEMSRMFVDIYFNIWAGSTPISSTVRAFSCEAILGGHNKCRLMITPYKNLVFEGGGVKGVPYGGVFEVLEQTKSRRRLNQR
jgi:hypothetical protein